MRISEVTEAAGGQYANIATTLSLLQSRINNGKLKPEVSTELVIRYIENTGLNGFNYQDLLAANNADPMMQNIVKNITPQTVTFVTDAEEGGAVNPEGDEAVEINPQQQVSNMAKSAAKRRQKPLF